MTDRFQTKNVAKEDVTNKTICHVDIMSQRACFFVFFYQIHLRDVAHRVAIKLFKARFICMLRITKTGTRTAN